MATFLLISSFMALSDSLTPAEFYWASPGVMGGKTQAVEVRWMECIDRKILIETVLGMGWVSLQLSDELVLATL